MDGLDDAGVNFGKLTLQQIGEKIMVANTRCVIIQRNDKQVVLIQKIKHLLAVVSDRGPNRRGKRRNGRGKRCITRNYALLPVGF